VKRDVASAVTLIGLFVLAVISWLGMTGQLS
jgi:hypothetical protein